jgi:cation diffusion facilitator CzcD-associated flavoprotein CzcO
MEEQNEGVLDALIIGAGFSGICLGKRLLDARMPNFRIVEKAPKPGGTWYWNSYPGAACDVQSHFYSFSFAPNPDWSRKYSPWNEIQAYAEYCVDKFGLRPRIDFGHEVQLARFDDASGFWEVSFTDGKRLRARHVIDGSGGLHVPLIPRFEGADSFQGESWHSSLWRHDVDLGGKRVAVIGSAASAVQIVPAIANVASRVTLFQRTANWIIPRHDRAYRDWEKWVFRHVPLVSKLYRLFLFLRYDWLAYPIVKTGQDNLARRWAKSQFRRLLNKSVKDPEMRARLTPDFPMGCKRILISDDFFTTLTRDNLRLVTEGIERFTPEGVRTVDGAEHAADVR